MQMASATMNWMIRMFFMYSPMASDLPLRMGVDSPFPQF
jgi:hypothetical protein